MKKLLMSALLSFVLSVSVVAQAAHSTTITITPPAAQTGVTITGFNVYKSVTSSGAYTLGSPYATVGATAVSYVDNAVTPGQKAWYVVTTLCSTCTTTESVFSNEITGTTPNPTVPNPPVISGTWK